jgi:non-heme chloroperoxidase
MPYLETPDSVPLYYEGHSSGNTVPLIHGWTMNAEYWWQKNTPELANSQRVVVLDLRGHGLSGKTDEGHTLAQYARDVRHLITALDLDGVTPVGWSMGTAVILNYLIQFGDDRLHSVVFVDQSPKFFSTEDWPYSLLGDFSPQALGVFAQDMRHDRRGAAKSFIAACFAEIPSAETIDEMYAESTKTPTGAALSVFMDMSYEDLRPAHSRVTVPSLLIYGAHSAIFPGDLGAWLHQQISNSKLVMFEQSGHCPFWEEPEKFNREVAAFVG